MSLRLIEKHSNGLGDEVKIYKDSDWGEFRVKHFENGKHQKDADYHTDDLEDAKSTGEYWLRSVSETRMGRKPLIKNNPKKSSSGDDVAAQELFWFITNDEKLYRQMAEPIFKNLSLKKLKNTYDHTKALKLWGYLADAGTKLYNKEHGSGKLSLQGFDVATRMLVADKLQDYYEDMLDPEMWAGQRGFKNVSVTARKNPRDDNQYPKHEFVAKIVQVDMTKTLRVSKDVCYLLHKNIANELCNLLNKNAVKNVVFRVKYL